MRAGFLWDKVEKHGQQFAYISFHTGIGKRDFERYVGVSMNDVSVDIQRGILQRSQDAYTLQIVPRDFDVHIWHNRPQGRT